MLRHPPAHPISAVEAALAELRFALRRPEFRYVLLFSKSERISRHAAKDSPSFAGWTKFKLSAEV